MRSTPSGRPSGLSSERLYDILAVCAARADVREEVLRNHDDNLWWPRDVEDWRLRMVIAGWSTRVSYAMISTYQRVVRQAAYIGYEKLCWLGDEALYNLVGSLGLFTARKQYLHSICAFIDGLDQNSDLLDVPNDLLINEIAERVKGAGYKVAQCAVLYAKGYHCGIFPVDSGMKDLLGPCLGLRLPKRPIAHEIMRKHMEHNLNSAPDRYRNLAGRSGYAELDLQLKAAPVWWAHLVLIYFKRLYCNQRSPARCPLRADERTRGYVGRMCDRETPEPGSSSAPDLH
jgi:hypothetical protein